MRGDVVLLWCHSNTHSTIHARMLSVRSAAAATTTITTEVQQEPCSHPISRHVTLCHISLVNIVVVELFIAKVAAVAVQGRDLTLHLYSSSTKTSVDVGRVLKLPHLLTPSPSSTHNMDSMQMTL